MVLFYEYFSFYIMHYLIKELNICPNTLLEAFKNKARRAPTLITAELLEGIFLAIY